MRLSLFCYQASDNHRSTSPSIYIAYTSLKAIATCVNGEKSRGKTYDSITIAYEPDAIKIGCGWAGPWSPININDFYNQFNNSYMETHGNCQSIAMLMESGAGYSTVAVSTAGDSPEWRAGTDLAGSHQVFSLPADLSTVDPAWSTCTPVYRGAWDPPRVLTPVAAVGPTTMAAPVSTVAPSPIISISPQLPTATQSTFDPEDSNPLPVFGFLPFSATRIASSSSSSSSVKTSKPEHHDPSTLTSEVSNNSDPAAGKPTISRNVQETPSLTVSTYVDPITSSDLRNPILDPITDTPASSDAHLSSEALHTHASSHSGKKTSSETETKSPHTLILQQTTDAHDNSRGSGVITRQSSDSTSEHFSQTAEGDLISATFRLAQISSSTMNPSSPLAPTPSLVSNGTKIVIPGNSSPGIEQPSSRPKVASSAPTLEFPNRTSKTKVTPSLPTEQSALVTGEHNSESTLGISSQVTTTSSAVRTAPASEDSFQDSLVLPSSVEQGTTTAVPETESTKRSTISVSPVPASASLTSDLTSIPPSSGLASYSLGRDIISSNMPSAPTFSFGAVRSMSAFKPSAVASAIIYDTASTQYQTSEPLTATPTEATMGGLASLMLSVVGNPHESSNTVSNLPASDSLPRIVYATRTMSSVTVATTTQEVMVDVSGTAATGDDSPSSASDENVGSQASTNQPSNSSPISPIPTSPVGFAGQAPRSNCDRSMLALVLTLAVAVTFFGT